MKTQYYTAATLDGFIATDEHSLDWLFPLADIDKTSYPSFIKDVGALVMGASTYEWLLRHGVNLGAPEETPWPYQVPAWVLSHRSHPQPKGADIRFAQGDVRTVYEEAAELAGGRNLWVVGGGEVAAQFYDAGLLDELIVQVGAVTLGSGKKLFPRTVLSPTLRLVSSHQFNEYMIELRKTIVK